MKWPGIAETKIVVPRVRANAIERTRLLELVDPDTALVVVIAPAGSGKSTFCAQLAADRAARGETVAWLTLDAQDCDPTRFWAHLLTAFDRLGLPLADGVDPETRPVTALSNAVANHHDRVTIFLDDYHAVPGSDIHLDVTAVVETLPAHAQIVIASRVDPTLPTPRLRVRGQLAEVRITDLNFTTDEATQLFEAAFRLNIDAGQLTRLHDRTEGWAAALYIAGLGLSRTDDIEGFIQTFSGDQAHVLDYLESEILQQQDAETLNFLLCTSILSELNADVCDSMLQTQGSAQTLEELERTNLLVIGLDNHRHTYRYHHLFSEALQSRLHRSAGIDINTLHARAGRWFADHDNPTTAVWHLVQAGKNQRARDVINRSWFDYINSGRSATVWTWLDLVPSETRNVDPLLCRLAAWAKLNLGAFDEIEPLLAVVDADEVGPSDNRVEADVIRSHRARHLGDTGAALICATRAAEHFSSSSPVLSASTNCALGIARFWAGDHDRAAETLRNSVAAAIAAREESAVVAGLGHHALLLATVGNTDRANELAHRSLQLCDTPQREAFHVPAAAHLALAKTALDAKQLAAVPNHLDQAASLAQRGREPLADALGSIWRAELHAIVGDRDSARRQARTAESRVGALADPGWIAEEFTRVRNELRFAPRTPTPSDHPMSPLTDREFVVLRMLTGTGTRQDIAGELHISLATVKSHIHAIARKLGVSKRHEIVAKARRTGLIP